MMSHMAAPGAPVHESQYVNNIWWVGEEEDGVEMLDHHYFHL